MNSTKILCSLKLNERFLFSLRKIPKLKRTFLTEAYECQLKWNSRFDNEILKTVNLNQLRFELIDKINNKQVISALDVDIFVNCIKSHEYLEDLGSILYELRRTKESSNTLDSTHHAVVRYLMKVDSDKELLTILNDRLNYGIFCDYYCYNLLMNHFIKKQDFASAAKVASFMMLQEEFENPISNALAIYSCHNYLKNPDTWQEEDPEKLIEQPKEEIKIRVKYLRNPYFDDHFDLWKPSDLTGKTLYWIGREINNPLGRSCQLRGVILYKKYKEAISILDEWKSNECKKVVYKDLLTLIEKDTSEIFKDSSDESIKQLQQLLSNLKNADLYEGNLDSDITQSVIEAINVHSEDDILSQNKIYDDWLNIRKEVLAEEVLKLKKQAKLENIKQMKKDLIKQEQILTFFDKQDEIELQIDQKLKKEEKLYGEDLTIKHYKEYVPHEIVKETLD